MSSEIHPLMRSRRSPRAFDGSCDISRAEVETLLEAARWAPSCFNEQPWRYIVCERSRDESAWRDLLDCLVEGNRRWAQHAPVLIAVLVDVSAAGAVHDEHIRFYDAGAASFSLCLQAHAQGLAAHQLVGFDRLQVRKAFDVAEKFDPVAVIAVGTPGNPDLLDERGRARELAPRVRRPITEFVAFGRAARPF